MKISLLGSNGFVGRHLAQELEERGHVLQRLHRPQFDLLQTDSFSFIDSQADWVICSCGTVGSSAPPLDHWLINARGVMELARFVAENLHSRVLLVSSGAVYGPSEKPLTTDSPLHPKGDYAQSKLASELALRHWLPKRSLIARIFFPYGPGQDAERLVPQLLCKLKSDIPITLKGTQGEPFLAPHHIADLSRELADDLTEAVNGVRNYGGAEISLREMASLLAAPHGFIPQWEFVPAASANFVPHVPQEILERQIPFAQGVQQLVAPPTPLQKSLHAPPAVP